MDEKGSSGQRSILSRHFFAISFVTLLCALLGSWAAWYNLNHYRAESILLFQDDLPKTLPGGLALHKLSVDTAVDLIALPVHLQTVQSILGLELSVNDMEKMVHVPNPRNDSALIRIICTSDNRNLSIDIANTLARIAVRSSREFTHTQLQKERGNFQKQFESASHALTDTLAAIEEFKKAHRYLEMTADYSSIVNGIADARTQAQEAQLHYNGLLFEFQNLKRAAEKMPEKVQIDVGPNPSQNPIQIRIATLQTSLAEAKAKYASGNPKIKILEDELAFLMNHPQESEPVYENNSEKAGLKLELMRMESKLLAAQQIKQESAASLGLAEKELATLPADQMAFARLLRAKQSAEERVSDLSKALESIQLLLNVPKGGLELYQLADKAKPLRDAWWVQILPLACLIGGFFLAMSAACLFENRS